MALNSDDHRRDNKQEFRVKIWGARGTLPVSGEKFRKYGGNTICIEVRCGSHVLLFDAGSGLLPAGQALKAEGIGDVNMFFSHCHYDHIIGFPYFKPFFNRENDVRIWSGHLAGQKTTHEIIAEFMSPPWFPVPLDVCCAQIVTKDFKAGDVLDVHPDLNITTDMLNHPGNAIGYRIDWQGRSLAIITDTEHETGKLDKSVLKLIDNVDLFLYDASFTEAEMNTYRGYGHSSWQQAVLLAKHANAKSVGLIHHAPFRTDDELEAIEADAQKEFAGVFAAWDGQTIEL
ncbi:MBL fold metallo-hydrolase [Agrobacterium rubi]|uniref:MBL fold metallo-hydrolase n=1 Tax=Agrobacterium rubi TaxID=28099 RepID=A0AAE7R5L1_9HYPH|nr:MBL fold metallo-hydrolase [Agrobacterium rubi]MBP1879799.1 phosphoribosyl 1,2-cyclic phosphodiesterase [Agrobacterium rubi]MCL6654389.1 MBL fold metallo-hydrolase [Agrobacterium rubi]NTE87334.1 MBL fold metallo-hydrolase [Agrobacterium rubi]NTF03635.1 MBL fold metallo-hydrolase [Agrobacterium rubi]NTF37794.1 MBL fold metallo-hydrolase [Agrobacterium rubi]